MDELLKLRNELDEVDAALIAAVAKRQAIVAEIGRIKHAAGKQLRDFQREREVLAHVRRRAEAVGLKGDLAEAVLKMLIEASLTTQEQDRLKLDAHGDGRRALVFGGNGLMGQWFVRFLSAQGFGVQVVDPSGAPEGFSAIANWHDSARAADLIVLATPMRQTTAVLDELVWLQPQALIFDIASIKAPLASALTRAAASGLKLCSLHPMFGPSTVLLSDRHVVYIDLGHAGAVEQARALFAPTMASSVQSTLEEHDQLIAWVLGLSHALNIAFFDALAHSGIAAQRLAQISSTTFERQLAVACNVADEDAALYHDIQHLNPLRTEVLTGLSSAVLRVAEAGATPERAAFTAMFERGRAYLGASKPTRS
jgi:chorismate mutase/prephenate dehydrogenase